MFLENVLKLKTKSVENKNKGTHKNVSTTHHKWVPDPAFGNQCPMTSAGEEDRATRTGLTPGDIDYNVNAEPVRERGRRAEGADGSRLGADV